MGGKGEGIHTYKLLVVKTASGCKVQHREYTVPFMFSIFSLEVVLHQGQRPPGDGVSSRNV